MYTYIIVIHQKWRTMGYWLTQYPMALKKKSLKTGGFNPPAPWFLASPWALWGPNKLDAPITRRPPARPGVPSGMAWSIIPKKKQALGLILLTYPLHIYIHVYIYMAYSIYIMYIYTVYMAHMERFLRDRCNLLKWINWANIVGRLIMGCQCWAHRSMQNWSSPSGG